MHCLGWATCGSWPLIFMRQQWQQSNQRMMRWRAISSRRTRRRRWPARTSQPAGARWRRGSGARSAGRPSHGKDEQVHGEEDQYGLNVILFFTCRFLSCCPLFVLSDLFLNITYVMLVCRGGDRTQAPRAWARGVRPNSFGEYTFT